MKLIAHRGNTQGPDPLQENSPNYIHQALCRGFDVEIDVWFACDCFYLGHNEPRYPIKEAFLEQEGLWCHAKNYQALEKMRFNSKIHCFWHQEDDYTLTSSGYVWGYPGKTALANAVLVVQGKILPAISCSKIVGYCGDYVLDWKNASL